MISELVFLIKFRRFCVSLVGRQLTKGGPEIRPATSQLSHPQSVCDVPEGYVTEEDTEELGELCSDDEHQH